MSEHRTTPVTPLVCEYCHHVDRAGDERGWRGYIVPGDNPNTEEVALFCSQCAWREFGHGHAR